MIYGGFDFALDNIQRGETSGRAAGIAEDRLPLAEREAFRAGVRMVEELTARQKLAIVHLLNDSANYGEARQLPKLIVAALRQRNANLDFVLSLVENGQAIPYLPPYEARLP